MRNILIFLMFVVIFSSCVNETNNDTTVVGPEKKVLTEQEKKLEAIKEAQKKETDNSDVVQTSIRSKALVKANYPVVGSVNDAISPQTMEVIQALGVDYWEVAAYVRFSLPEVERIELAKKNVGRWLKFNPDGTFQGGKYLDANTMGQWFYDPSLPGIYLDHEKLRDEEYTIKLNSEKTIMVWIGTDTFKESGIQAKLENTSDLPKPR